MEDVAALIAGIEEEKTLAAVSAALDSGIEPLALIDQLRAGMAEVGERFEAKEYFLPELIMSAEIFNEAVNLITPRLASEGQAKGKPVVIGTVAGDIHDIGKNIVSTILKCTGYDVHDIGVDQPPAAFVAKARETGAGLVGLSGLLTVAFDSMKETTQAFEEAGMRDQVKIIIGGGPVNDTVCQYACADAWGADPTQALRLVERYLGDTASVESV
ncbi:MAG TPA: cobalamin-dependent protein [Candidatus Anoxymicrobiaceae bacterium]